jgi:hypothetical protein
MAIKVNGTTVINDSRALQNIASVDSTTATAIGNAGVGGGTTLLATTTLSGAREITVSSLNLSGYDLLYAFAANIEGGNYYDSIHIKASGQTTNFNNFWFRAETNGAGYGNGGCVIDLNTGYGFGGGLSVASGATNWYYERGVGMQTGITTSTTSIIYGHTEGNSSNWNGGTIKLYGA